MPTDLTTPSAPPTDAEGRTLVRSTIRPDVELWATDTEVADLERNGLLLDGSAPRPEDAGAAPARARKTETKES